MIHGQKQVKCLGLGQEEIRSEETPLEIGPGLS